MFHKKNYFKLVSGCQTDKPGHDIYFYTFQLDGFVGPGHQGQAGQRGDFVSGEKSFQAELFETNGNSFSLLIKSSQPLPMTIKGRWQPHGVRLNPVSDIELQDHARDGLAAFLDQENGWLMTLAEAGQKKSQKFDPQKWPQLTVENLAGKVQKSLANFIWAIDDFWAYEMMQVLWADTSERCLILAQEPSSLRRLVKYLKTEEAFYLGLAPSQDALYPFSQSAKIEEGQKNKDHELQEWRSKLSVHKSQEANVKDQLAKWARLELMEEDFLAMGQELARHKINWQKIRDDFQSSHINWEAAALKTERRKQGGFLSFFKKKDSKAIEELQLLGEELTAREFALGQVRKEEEMFLKQASQLDADLRLYREEAKTWVKKDTLKEQLLVLQTIGEELAAKIVSIQKRPSNNHKTFYQKAKVVFGLLPQLDNFMEAADDLFSNVIILFPHAPDHLRRHQLAQLVFKTSGSLVLLADFSSWVAPSPPCPVANSCAWQNFLLTPPIENQGVAKTWLGHIFHGLPSALAPFHQLEPEKKSWVKEIVPTGFGLLDLSAISSKGLVNLNNGASFRAFGELGPSNPVSAFLLARAALRIVRNLENESETQIYIVTPSFSQKHLISLILTDLGAPAAKILAGEVDDLASFCHSGKKVPLLIFDAAFEEPHLTHPWAWPDLGRQDLLRAMSMAENGIILAARSGWLEKLPASSPLAYLWNLGWPLARLSLGAAPQVPPFWEALDKAKKSLWAILPDFEELIWKQLEPHFLAALRRRCKVTVIVPPPSGPQEKRDFAMQSIRNLALYGASVVLGKNFPPFMAVIDDSHFTWGPLEPTAGWSALTSAELPKALPFLAEIIQLPLILEKLSLSRGGVRNCPLCGWPLILINQEKPRGFGDAEALRLSCLGDACKIGRRLDERWPLLKAPICGVDQTTSYVRQKKQRQEFWVCPKHPDGLACPAYKVSPGDPLVNQ